MLTYIKDFPLSTMAGVGRTVNGIDHSVHSIRGHSLSTGTPSPARIPAPPARSDLALPGHRGILARVPGRVGQLLFLDGVYISGKNGSYVRFRRVKAPTGKELTQLTHTIAQRTARYLERQGLLERDSENSYLTSCAGDDGRMDQLHQLLKHSITYRIAVGPQQGRKVFTLEYK